MCNMKIETFLPLETFLVLLSVTVVCSGSPHIIFILVDDLGWNDVSFHGSTQIPTPNIDTLAYSGIILNNYYVQPLCTPSRGALMTGKYPIKLGLQHYVIAATQPWGLSPEEVLLPQYLKKLGYSTHGVGKWHLGFFREDYIPSNRGFDSFLGFWKGKDDYFTHFDEERGASGLDFHDNEKSAWNYTGYYSTEAFTERAKKIIQNHDTSKPLFLYIAHQAVHTGNSYSPMQVPKEYSDQFPHIKDEKRRQFAGMASALDKSIGEVFSALDEVNMLENSIIVFSTDNGGAVEGIDSSTGSNWPLRGSKYNLWEGGIRGTAFIWSPLLPSFKGSVSNNLMHIIDWLPTLYDAAGGDPKTLGSVDGFNFWPSFINNSSSPREHVLYNIDEVWNVESIRRGQYKLLKGSTLNGQFDGWFDKEGKKMNNTPFSNEDLNIQHEVYKTFLEESEVVKILSRKYKRNLDFKFNFNWRNTDQETEHCKAPGTEIECDENITSGKNGGNKFLHYFGTPVEIDCGAKPTNASINCQPLKEYCLFDIEKDPCEFNNIASNLPNVVQELKELLDKYRKQAVPIRNKPDDPLGNPKYHGYAWVPWVESPDQNVV